MGNAHFIAIEGIDGAGKRTQIELLTAWLDARGMAHQRISFPRYDSFFGRMVGQFLDGAFGPLDRVDAHLSAMLYASDRFEAKSQLEQMLRQRHSILVADRYIASNLAHQSARVPPEQRDEFLRWLKQLEYEVYGLPVEDLVIYLRVPARIAQQQIAQKSARDYTARSHDIQEADLRHLEEAAKVYDALARASNWVTVECFDAAAKQMRAPEAIHGDVVKAVEVIGVVRSRGQEVRK